MSKNRSLKQQLGLVLIRSALGITHAFLYLEVDYGRSASHFISIFQKKATYL